MPANLIKGKHAVRMVTSRLQIAAEQTRRPQRVTRLHLVIDVALGLGLR